MATSVAWLFVRLVVVFCFASCWFAWVAAAKPAIACKLKACRACTSWAPTHYISLRRGSCVNAQPRPDGAAARLRKCAGARAPCSWPKDLGQRPRRSGCENNNDADAADSSLGRCGAGKRRCAYRGHRCRCCAGYAHSWPPCVRDATPLPMLSQLISHGSHSAVCRKQVFHAEG